MFESQMIVHQNLGEVCLAVNGRRQNNYECTNLTCQRISLLVLTNVSTIPGKLTQPEETDAAAVSVGTYQAYIAAAGGWTVAVCVISVYVVAAGSLVLSGWLLSRWLDSGRLSVHFIS